MNKILVSSEGIDLKENYYVFDNNSNYFVEVNSINNKISFDIKDNVEVVLNILGNKSNFDFDIKIGENSSFKINSFIINGCINVNCLLDGRKSCFRINNSILVEDNIINKIAVKHNNSYTESLLKNHGFSLDGANIIFDVSSYIPKDINGCIAKQDSKIIQNENSLSQINPILYIDNYDVEASHSAYVGEFKESELFYLMSRGISLEDAKFLLLKSFLVGCMDISDDIMQQYCNSIVKYFNKEV